MPEIDSKTVLVTIAGEFFQNIFFYGIGAVAIVAISIYISWWFAFILFLGFTTVVVFSVLQQVLVLGTNALYLYGLVTGKMPGHLKDYGFLAGANLVQLIEMSIMIIFALGLYRELYLQ